MFLTSALTVPIVGLAGWRASPARRDRDATLDTLTREFARVADPQHTTPLEYAATIRVFAHYARTQPWDVRTQDLPRETVVQGLASGTCCTHALDLERQYGLSTGILVRPRRPQRTGVRSHV
jgi:hypothetical protein